VRVPVLTILPTINKLSQMRQAIFHFHHRSANFMSTKTVKCVKLDKELPGIDGSTPEGQRALKMATLFGGPTLRDRVEESISLEAWEMWKDHMLMVMNEFRLDPSSDEANQVLGEQMQQFFFGQASQVPGYTPEKPAG
jgi:Fe-S cluster biosynthesis and repair protein YggX